MISSVKKYKGGRRENEIHYPISVVRPSPYQPKDRKKKKIHEGEQNKETFLFEEGNVNHKV